MTTRRSWLRRLLGGAAALLVPWRPGRAATGPAGAKVYGEIVTVLYCPAWVGDRGGSLRHYHDYLWFREPVLAGYRKGYLEGQPGYDDRDGRLLGYRLKRHDYLESGRPVPADAGTLLRSAELWVPGLDLLHWTP